MIQSWQLRAHISPSPAIDIEATSGSLTDYDDRNGYLPDFLGQGSDLVVPLPLLRDTSDLVQVERAPAERPFELRHKWVWFFVSPLRVKGHDHAIDFVA